MATELQALVDEYVSGFANLNAPDWYINPDFRVVLQGEAGRDISAATPLNFAPGLLDVLQSDKPPSPDYWLSTPTPAGKFWGVYAALLTKDGCEPALCIGSGTDAKNGYQSRIAHYSDKTHPQLPRFVRQLYDRGFDLAHIGLICWAPIPSVTIIPRARHRFVALEGTFTNIFYSAIPTIMDGLWVDLVPWSRDDVLWRPLNTHTPFNEGPKGDLQMTPKELLFAEEQRKKRKVVMAKQYREKNAESIKKRQKEYRAANWDTISKKVREAYDRERAADIDAFRLKMRLLAVSWVARNKEKVRGIQKTCKEKILREKRFFCKTCQKPFRDSSKLNRHMNSDRHKNKVNGNTHRQLYDAAARADVRKARKHWCAPCQQPFDSDFHLQKHKKCDKHLNKVKLLESAASDTSEKSVASAASSP